MAASNKAREPTLGPDKNPFQTPPSYTPPHRPQPNNTSTPSWPELDPNLGMPQSENLSDIPSQNQSTTLATTSFVPSLSSTYNMPFFPLYYPYPHPTMYQQQPFISQYSYATSLPFLPVTPEGQPVSNILEELTRGTACDGTSSHPPLTLIHPPRGDRPQFLSPTPPFP
jgi:hypothetical protein